MFISKQNLTVTLLKEYLDYDPITGELTWIKKLSKKVIVGKRAGTKVKNRDNRIIKVFGEVYIEHRLIWFMYYGVWPKNHIDHINHNEADNRISNLREVSQLENNINCSLRKDNSLGITGVYVNKNNSKKRFTVEIRYQGQRKIKSFDNISDAINQRKLWENYFGFHSNHGIQKVI